jgi:putative ABC transport system ATP-binding protein
MRLVVREAMLRFGDVTVFDGLNAVFESGAVTALMGPSGSGKSSLLAAMAGLLRLTSGSVTLEDHGLVTRPTPEKVAWVPQGANALSRRSALDNVRVAAFAAGLDPRKSLEVSHLNLSKVGLGSKAAQQARTLSGGELQRLALARALASGRSVVFADEPTASLDYRNADTVIATLANLSTSATVVVATHDHRLAERADYVVEMHTGG